MGMLLLSDCHAQAFFGQHPDSEIWCTKHGSYMLCDSKILTVRHRYGLGAQKRSAWRAHDVCLTALPILSHISPRRSRDSA